MVKYKLKKAEPGSGVPTAWRLRPDAAHPEGLVVTAADAVEFDLDAYFPRSVPGNGREWFEAVPDESAKPSSRGK